MAIKAQSIVRALLEADEEDEFDPQEIVAGMHENPVDSMLLTLGFRQVDENSYETPKPGGWVNGPKGEFWSSGVSNSVRKYEGNPIPVHVRTETGALRQAHNLEIAATVWETRDWDKITVRLTVSAPFAKGPYGTAVERKKDWETYQLSKGGTYLTKPGFADKVRRRIERLYRRLGNRNLSVNNTDRAVREALNLIG